MRFTTLIAAAILALGVSTATNAEESRGVAIGPVRVGMTIEEVMAALPDADWQVTRVRETHALAGAKASAAITFEGERWDVEAGRNGLYQTGEIGGDDRRLGLYDLRFTRRPVLNERQCRAAFEQTVTLFESRFGAFGTDPTFANEYARLYDNANWGPGMRIERVGAMSAMRIWPRTGPFRPMLTIREPDAAVPYRFEISTSYMGDIACSISFRLFEDPVTPAPNTAPTTMTSYESEPPAVPNYVAPPATLALPADASIASVTASRGNLAAWRNAERRRLGDYNYSSDARRTRGAIGPVEGYFAVFSSDGEPAGIAHGRWRDADSEVDQPSRLIGLTFSHPHSVCGATIPWVSADIADMTYLGNVWRPEYDALDTALGGAPDARNATGREVAEGEQVLYSVGPRPQDISRYYPPRAQERDVQGRVVMKCLVRQDLSTRCGIVSIEESPFAFSFKVAAWRVMQLPYLRVAPTSTLNTPTPGMCINRGVMFALG